MNQTPPVLSVALLLLHCPALLFLHRAALFFIHSGASRHSSSTVAGGSTNTLVGADKVGRIVKTRVETGASKATSRVRTSEAGP